MTSLFRVRAIQIFFICAYLLAAVACKKSSVTQVTDKTTPLNPVKVDIFNGVTTDIVVYGSTSSGIIAAIQAAKMGKDVILVSEGKQIGGMTTGGLCLTDIVPGVVGGLTKEFYQRVAAKYNESTPSYVFEPKVALQVFTEMLGSYPSIHIYNDRILLKDGVNKTGDRIDYITLESGRKVAAAEFIDASYEGDLLAQAGVQWTMGRESNSQYGEQFNGVTVPQPFPVSVSGYKIEDDPSSGLLARVNSNNNIPVGTADDKIQAYNFRLCLTSDKSNQVTITKPDSLNMSDYELMFRMIKKGYKTFIGFNKTKNNKIDVNSAFYFSTDFVGMNSDYIKGSYTDRKRIEQRFKTYVQGLIWLIQNDSRIPADVQKLYRGYGLAKDEFTNNDYWPTQFYIREARRMVSNYVLTEKNVLKDEKVVDPIGCGAYPIDFHLTQYKINAQGIVEGEGHVYHSLPKAYGISYRSIVPMKSECKNLAVSICISASHSAFGSLRMEPQYMIMGQAAGTAAVLAINKKSALQDIDYDDLRQTLKADKQILVY